jgi:hypothetical protein
MIDWFGYIIPKLLLGVACNILLLSIIWAISRIINRNQQQEQNEENTNTDS